MPKEAKIDILKNCLKSASTNSSQFKDLWESYPMKKSHISELVALACEKNRKEELIFLLSDYSMHSSLKDVSTSNNYKTLFPIVHAFYYGQLTCVDYLMEHQSLLVQKFTHENLRRYTQDGLSSHQRQGALFPALANTLSYRTKETNFRSLIQRLDTIRVQNIREVDPVQAVLPVLLEENISPAQPTAPNSTRPASPALPPERTLLTPSNENTSHVMQRGPLVNSEPAAEEKTQNPCLYFKDLMSLLNRDELDALNTSLTAITKKTAILLREKNDVMQLAHSFLSTWKLGQWVIKDNGRIQNIHPNRDAVLQNKSSANFLKLELIERLFFCVDNELFGQLSEGDHLHPLLLESWYVEQVNEQGNHFPHDPSDDSDSEDERDNCSPKRRKQHQDMAALHSISFWERTQKKTLLAKEKSISKLESSLKRQLKERARLQSPDPGKPLFIPAFRGNNYLEDRWTLSRKRRHYYLDEVEKPHYSEAAMMAAGNFYQEEALHSSEKRLRMDETAESIQKSHHDQSNTGPCIALTRKPGQELFAFNSFGDYLQHHYSNGISDHLKQLVGMLQAKDRMLSQSFPNAYNYAISTSDRPYHSLRYALGLKDYYHHPFTPRYNQDGSIQNVHAGKFYIFLFTLQEMQDPYFVNRVNSMLQNGQCPVLRDISSEVETTLFGKVDGKHVVYQFQLRFPSFNKDYKAIYQVKYGMDKALYTQFQSLLTSIPFKYTSEAESSRDEVIELLKEWLCAYYEVMALDMARQLAKRKGGDLMYYNEQNQLSSMPPQRPLVNGKEHLSARRKMHVLEETRRYIAKKLKPESLSVTAVAFMKIDLKAEVQKLLLLPSVLLEIAKKVGAKLQLTASEEEWYNSACTKPGVRRDDVLDELYSSIVKEILQSNLDTFRSAPAASRRSGLCSWQAPTAKEFKDKISLVSAACNSGFFAVAKPHQRLSSFDLGLKPV